MNSYSWDRAERFDLADLEGLFDLKCLQHLTLKGVQMPRNYFKRYFKNNPRLKSGALNNDIIVQKSGVRSLSKPSMSVVRKHNDQV